MELPDKSVKKPSPKREIKQVITGAQTVQRPATRRFFNFLLAESPKPLLGRIGRDVLVPRAKAGLEEAMNSFIHGMFWGAGAAPLSQIARGTVLRGGAVNYQQVSSAEPSALLQAQQAAAQRTSGGNYKDVVADTQEKAEILLANMFDLLNRYRVVAVADLYESAGITSAPSDNSFGWTSLDGARITKIREGYLLELPRPSLI